MPGDQIQCPGMAERAAKFRQLLAWARCLILLDNTASAEQVRPLLSGDSGVFVLITGRRMHGGEYPAASRSRSRSGDDQQRDDLAVCYGRYTSARSAGAIPVPGL